MLEWLIVLLILHLSLGWLIVLLILHLFLIFWVMGDAELNSSTAPGVWGAFVFFFGILGFVIYLLVGRDLKGSSSKSKSQKGGSSGVTKGELDETVWENISSVHCPDCGSSNQATTSFCFQCGGCLETAVANKLDKLLQEMEDSINGAEALLEEDKLGKAMTLAMYGMDNLDTLQEIIDKNGTAEQEERLSSLLSRHGRLSKRIDEYTEE